MRNGKWGPAVDHRDDGCACGGGSHNSRQLDFHLRRLELIGLADDLLRLEVDEVCTRSSPYRCVHEILSARSDRTSSVARLAAGTGVRPSDLAARRATELVRSLLAERIS